jgi:hypothetical protein
MPFCVRGCEAPGCDGIISVQLNASGSSTIVGGSCSSNSGGGGGGQQFVPGPINGTVSVQAYAFSSGKDPWLGVRCVSRASASQNNIIKYDGKTDKHYIIPTSNHSGQYTGLKPEGVTLNEPCFSGETYSAQLVAGSVTVSTKMGLQVGYNFEYSGDPLSVTFPDKKAYSVSFVKISEPLYLNQFTLDIDYPNSPAIAGYGWQFLRECK